MRPLLLCAIEREATHHAAEPCRIDDDSHINVNGKSIKVVSSRDPLKLPWKEMGVDLVIEGTGVFLNREGAGKHLEAGAKKVRDLLIGRRPSIFIAFLYPCIIWCFVCRC